MWTFFVELGAIEEPESGVAYPDLLFSHGEMPATAPDATFTADNDDIYGEFEDDYDEDDLDMLDGEDMGFDEGQWN